MTIPFSSPPISSSAVAEPYILQKLLLLILISLRCCYALSFAGKARKVASVHIVRNKYLCFLDKTYPHRVAIVEANEALCEGFIYKQAATVHTEAAATGGYIVRSLVPKPTHTCAPIWPSGLTPAFKSRSHVTYNVPSQFRRTVPKKPHVKFNINLRGKPTSRSSLDAPTLLP